MEATGEFLQLWVRTRQPCFKMIPGRPGASVPPAGGFTASVVESLLVGDSAVGETEAVQMSPCVPTASTCIPYSKLEQGNQRRGKNMT